MPSDVDKAVKYLQHMRVIVNADLLQPGDYFTGEHKETGRVPKLAESLCGGVYVCAVGSLWAAAGMVERNEETNLVVGLRHVAEPDRRKATLADPALGLAYDALNAQAVEFYETHEAFDDSVDDPDDASAGLRRGAFSAPLEDLFELNYESGRIDKSDILELIDNARATLEVRALT